MDPGWARTELGPQGSCRGTFPSLEPNKVVVGEIPLSIPALCGPQVGRVWNSGADPCRARDGVSIAVATGHLPSVSLSPYLVCC